MKIGMIGLGKMGSHMVERLLGSHHECVIYDLEPKNIESLSAKGAIGAQSIADMLTKLPEKKIVWLMLPAGEITEKCVTELANLLMTGDIIIDGGNTFYKDDVRRNYKLAQKGINYLDVGTSGGVWGVKKGYCLMIGGDKNAYEYLIPIFKSLAPGAGSIPRTSETKAELRSAEEGYIHCGPAGSGHFVKMIHNGIEYGIMESFAEGFDILKNANSKDLPAGQRFDLNLSDIAEVWRRGSVISSWLLDLIAIAISENPKLSNYMGYVQDSGEGRWTIEAAIEEAVPCDVLSAALFARFRSRQSHSFADKLLSAMREQFGGHVEKTLKESII